MSAPAIAPAASRSALLTGTRVAPSILSADYARLGEQVQEVLDAGARVVHCDVMDGHFVPPITFGAAIVGALSDRIHAAGGLVDVHLMIEEPERHVESFAHAGADLITIHVEATANLHYAMGMIRAAGCLAGVAINPGTPAEQIAPVAELADLALCMTVNPGWGGQRFIASTLGKIARVRSLVSESCAVQVDGGVDAETGPLCTEAGANVLVAGSAVFGTAEPGRAFGELTQAVGAS